MKFGVLDKRMLKHIDWVLFANIMVLVMLSLVAIASALSEPLTEDTGTIVSVVSQLDLEYVFAQLTWLGIGLVVMFILLLPDYHAIGEYYRWIYVGLVLLLVAVFLFGTEVNGTKGWFRIGTAGFQPSEVGKTGMVLVLARMLANRAKGKDGGIKRIRDILPVVGVFAVPFVLVLIQPDWGTALVYAFTFVAMLFMAKTSWKIIVGVLAAGGVAVPIAWAVMADWQKDRIYGFMGIPMGDMSAQEISDLTMQADRAKQAVGRGEIWGKGLFSLGGETQASRIPENHTDFIFASTTEAIGFVGAMIIMLLYFTLIIRTLYLATKAKDEFGKLIIIGVLAMTLFHMFENIGMNIGVMPITGIPLPFFSYGGSNLLTNMIAFGLVLNVSMRRQKWSI